MSVLYLPETINLLFNNTEIYLYSPFFVFKSFEKGVVYVILKGACSGCPSSTITLKQGIENLLKQKLGNDIKEVMAYNG